MGETPLVAVLMGSASDAEVMAECTRTLTELGVPHEAHVLSAHRSPQRLREFVQAASGRGIELFIAGAGMSAALPGAVAALTTLPVIGVPLASGTLGGLDALLAVAQMPPGVPVACVAIGPAGARNAAYLAAQILGLKHADIAAAYERHRRQLAEQ